MTTPIIPPVIAHRGACGYAPENTLAAFLKAKQLGAKWVEFDVMLTACGELVVIHDETLDRTTSGKGRVIDYPYSFLKTLDAGSWFGQDFSGQMIPTLQAVLAFLDQNNMCANIELKAQKGMEKITAQKVLDIVASDWKASQQPLLSSFSLPTLKYLREFSSTCLIGFLMDKWLENWQETCDQLNCIAVDVNHEILNAKRVENIKSTGRWLLSYTVNDTELARKLFKLGVHAVFTDFPDRILKSL